MQSHRLEMLDFTRGVAAAAVWLFHLKLFDYGYLGVPLFFAISGFVITASCEGRTRWQFTVARAARLYPAFWLSLALTCIALSIDNPIVIAANATILPHFLGQPYVEGAYWSLMYEVIFYAWIALIGIKHLKMACYIWLALSVVNMIREIPGFQVLFALDYAPYFAIGISIYLRSRTLWIASIGLSCLAAALQTAFNPVIAAAFALTIGLIFPLLVKQRNLPFSGTIAALSYPVYLLHNEFGLAVANKTGSTLLSVAVVLIMAWIITRIEPYGKRLMLRAKSIPFHRLRIELKNN